MSRTAYRALAVILGLLVAAAMIYPGNAAHSATGWQRVAHYPMTEGPRQRVLHDTWNGLDGTIGAKVDRNGQYLHFRNWPFSEPLDLAKTARVYSDNLNPGNDDFAVSWRFRSDSPKRFQNMIQKGQGGGPVIKFRLDKDPDVTWSTIDCFWRGQSGAAFTTTPKGVDYTDGRWHLVRCAREGGRTTLTVDGVRVDTDTNPGAITNAYPLAFGGNVTSCDDVAGDPRHCNYLSGDLDWVKIRRLP
jgi:hypothetical protein